MAQAALPRRRTHAIKEQRILTLRRRHVEVVVPRVNFQPRHAALIQLLKQRPEPIRMLIVNGNGLFESIAVSICLVAHESSHLAPTFGASFKGRGRPAALE